MTDLLDAVRALGPRIRELAPQIERDRTIPSEVIEALRATGLFTAFAPRAIGGGELPLQDVLDAIAELSRADASTGWVAMIAAASSFGLAGMPEVDARALVAEQPGALMVGVFAPTGRATRVEDGVQVSGRWAFCSGVRQSDNVSLNAILEDSGEVVSVIVPTSAVEILDTWHVSGLRGTGSHDVTLDEAFVPASRFLRFADPVHPGPLYRFPAVGLLAVVVAAVALGTARAAIDELVELAGGKTPTGSRRRLADRAHAQMEVAAAEAEVSSADALLRARVADMWHSDDPTLEHRAALRLAASNAVRSSTSAVDRMYTLGGGTAIYETSRLQRCFRDIHAVTQHIVVAPATYELVGRILLGVETDVSQL
jgi:indole-3-acetate monooxygenase